MPGLYGYVRLQPQAPAPDEALAAMLAAAPAGIGPATMDHRVVAGDRAVLTRQLPTVADPDPTTDVLVDGYLVDRGGAASDAVALQSWHDEGADFADLDGDYNVVFLGDGDRDLTVVGSRHGSRHLYVRTRAAYVAFATHVSSLAALPGEVEVDDQAVAEMFNYGYPGGERSLLADVRLLPPASRLEVSATGVRLVTYWQPAFDNDTPVEVDEWIDEGARRLSASVDAALRRFPRSAIPLSGGLDSRAILAFAARQRPGLPVHHCSWYAGEAAIARQLAEVAQAHWHEYDPLGFDFASILDEGSRTSGGSVHAHQFWFLPVARAIGESGEVDAVLDGYLMDVFFGDTFLVLPGPETETTFARQAVIDRLWRRCHPRFAQRVFRPAFAAAYEEGHRAHLAEQTARIHDEGVSNYIHRFSFANRSNRYSVALPNVQRQHVEYVYPGLSRSLVDLYLRTPPAIKQGAAFSRAILARHAPRMAAVPWAKTGRPLTEDKSRWDRLVEAVPLRQAARLALLRLTRGRVDRTHRADLNRHFRRDDAFRRAHLAIVDDERTFSRGWIEPAGLRRLVDLIDGGWPVFFLLQCLVTVELFHRRVVDR